MPNGKVLYYSIQINLGLASIEDNKGKALLKDVKMELQKGDEISFDLVKISEFNLVAENI